MESGLEFDRDRERQRIDRPELDLARQPRRCRAWIGYAAALAIAAAITAVLPVTAAERVAPATSVAAHARVSAASIAEVDGRTLFTVELSRGVPTEIFTLPDPYRVVVELPGVVFDLPAHSGSAGSGGVANSTAGSLIAAYRFGAFAEGRSRIVIETTNPVAVTDAALTRAPNGVRLQFALSPVDRDAFGAGTGVDRVETAARPAAAAGSRVPQAIETGTVAGPPPAARAKPLVVIDPGHGGIDPGAVGVAMKTMEKTIVLAVAWQLKRALDATGRYETKMTRTTDVFITLDKRVQMSEEARADLFVSLHADAIDDASAQSATGASIYTLSDKASDEQARKMAEKENAADLVAGVGRRSVETADEVRGILSDLWARENSVFSHLFQKSLVASLSRMKALARTPERSAAFRVLRQSHAPAVLIELGFLSNPAEESRLSTMAWQKSISQSIAAAIDTYFERRKDTAAATRGP